jgi:hypothetical protein
MDLARIEKEFPGIAAFDEAERTGELIICPVCGWRIPAPRHRHELLVDVWCPGGVKC